MGVSRRPSRGGQAGRLGALAALLYPACRDIFTPLSTHVSSGVASGTSGGFYGLVHVHSWTALGPATSKVMGAAACFVGFGTPRMPSAVLFMGNRAWLPFKRDLPQMINSSVRESPQNSRTQACITSEARALPPQLPW